MNHEDEAVKFNRAAIDRACDKWLKQNDPQYKKNREELSARMLKSHADRRAAKLENRTEDDNDSLD
jgi:hypothetical protein